MNEDDLLSAIFDLQRRDLERWCARGLVKPASADGAAEYRAVDVARVHLICEMRRDLAVNEEGIAVALDLMDQLYEARARLHAVGEAVMRQPDDIRTQIETLVRRNLGG